MLQHRLLVLAGGFGTRLHSAVADVPKPLAPVAERPYLHYQIEHWVNQGAKSLFFLLHHQAEMIDTFLESECDRYRVNGCKFQTITEPSPLGTGGAIAYAVQELRLTDSFLVTNADTWLGSGIAQLSASAAPSMAVVSVNDSSRYGRLRLGPSLHVEAFEEKSGGTGPTWINAGLYNLHPCDFSDWNGEPFSLERELFPKLAAAGRLRAVPLDAEFLDIGVPADYFRFCRWIQSGRRVGL